MDLLVENINISIGCFFEVIGWYLIICFNGTCCTAKNGVKIDAACIRKGFTLLPVWVAVSLLSPCSLAPSSLEDTGKQYRVTVAAL
jgi:hypothetical protein